MKYAKAAIGVLLAIACTIAYLALTDEYERAITAPPKQARVLDVRGSEIRYELHEPGSSWDKDGDGWIGPYVEKDAPAEFVSKLAPGAPLVVRQGKLEASLSRPSKLLLVGIVMSLLFTAWAFVGPVFEARALKRAAADPQRFFELMVRKTRTTKLAAGLLLLVMSGGIAAIAAVAEAKAWERMFIFTLSAMGFSLGAVVLYGAWELRDVVAAPILLRLREQPHRIVWIYEYHVVVNEVTNYNIYLHCDDGQKFEFNLGQWEPMPLLNMLENQLPHAVFGFSEARQEVYRRSPQTFLANVQNRERESP